jgi:hypothetical protein
MLAHRTLCHTEGRQRMTPRPTLIVRGEYLPRDQIQQIWLSSGSLPLTATIRMHDGTEHHVIGEEAEVVRAQSHGLPMVVVPASHGEHTVRSGL